MGFLDLAAAPTPAPSASPTPPPPDQPKRHSFLDLSDGAGAPKPAAPTGTSPGGHSSFLSLAGVPAPGSDGGSGIQKVGRGIGSALGTASNALDLPLAAAEGVLSGKGIEGVKKDFQAGGGMHDIPGALSNVAENDVYFRKGSLERVLHDPNASEWSKSQARALEANPNVAAMLDFGTELVNPSNLAMGGVGKVAGAVGRIPAIANAADEAQAFSRVGNRFAGLRVAGRDAAKTANPNAGPKAQYDAAHAAENWGRRLINAGKKGDESAYNEGMSIFHDLTRPEQEEVVHRMQGNTVKDFGAAKNAEIDARSQQLGQSLWRTTRDQLKQGTIEPSKIYGREEMFPGVFSEITHGATTRGMTNAEEETIADRARTGERPEYVPKTSIADPHLTPANAQAKADRDALNKATNDQLNERADLLKGHLDSDKAPSDHFTFFPMAGAFNEPGVDAEYREYLAAHAGSGSGKDAVRMGTAAAGAPRRGYATLKEAQEQSTRGLREDWSPADAYYRFAAQRNKNVGFESAMSDLMGMGLVKPEAERTAGDRFANVGDVSAARLFGSPTLRQQAAHQHVVNFLEEAGATKGDASAFAAATSFLGRAARAFPKAYNTSQSLIRQSVIANPIVHGGWNLMSQYLGAGGDVRYLAGVNKEFAEAAEKYGAVTSRGAPHTLAGGSAIADASRPYSDLNAVEKMSRVGSDAQDWNAKLVFDVVEKRYAEALYKTFVKKGMPPEEAGTRVRQALGDYANVSNAGMDAILKQAFFFYPWLKTILPFWVKNGITKPQTWNPIAQGLQTRNELEGDPNFGTGNESLFTAYTGQSKGAQPRPEYYSVPVVQRILGQIGDLVGGLATNDEDAAKRGFKGLLLNRLNPAVAGGVTAGQSLISGTQQPMGPMGYAPIVDRVVNAAQSLGDYIPGPVKAAVDGVKLIFGQEQIVPDAVAGELVGGTGYVGNSPQQKALEGRLKSQYYRAIDRDLKSGNKMAAWQHFQMMQKAMQAAGFAQLPLVKNHESSDELNPMPLEAPDSTTKKEPVQEAPAEQVEPSAEPLTEEGAPDEQH